MADVLVICIREEDKDDFIMELIKGLMSRGLTVSYAGAFYSERKDEYSYDSVTNLLFFASTYFREAPMKSKDFKKWKNFLDNIDFEGVEAKTIVYVITEKTKLGDLEEDFRDYLRTHWTNMAVELIRSSFEKDFSAFESYYPEIVEILGLDCELIEESRNRITESELRREEVWGSTMFDIFIRKCEKVRNEIRDRGKPTKKVLQELEKLQKEVEIDCFEDPLRSERLVIELFREEVINRAAENPERRMVFDISRRCPRKKILCLYLEEKGHLEEKRNRFALYFYPKKPTEEKAEEPTEEKAEEPTEEKAEEPTEEKAEEPTEEKAEEPTEEKAEEPTEEKAEEPIPTFVLPEIPRNKKEFETARKLYAPNNIKEIVDKYVMLALHPSLVNIFFPTNGLMLELDLEEPEIGFLSGRIEMDESQTLEEILRIDPELREELSIYRFEEEGKKFHKLETGYRSRNQKEDILIPGRMEDLYRVFIARKRRGLIYRLGCSLLKPLVILLVPLVMALGPFFLGETEALPMLFEAIIVLISATFVFWALRTFILKYLLEPIYVILKWSYYFVLLVAIVFFRTKSMGLVGLGLLFVPLLTAIILFGDYVCSAVLYELNDLFGIIKHDDTLKITNPTYPSKIDTMYARNCGRFQTIVRKNDEKEVFFNSDLFPMIKYVQKRPRTLPRKAAYASGVFLPSKDQDGKNELVEEMIYRKPRSWGYWRTLESFFFNKKEIKSTNAPDDRPPSSTRFIYFGKWDQVRKCIGSAIPVSPQLVLFRNMIILTALSGLIFNFFRVHIDKISLTNLINWIEEINRWNIVFYLIIPLIWFILARKLKFRFWKAVLVLVFSYLLWFQPFHVKALTAAGFGFILILFLLRFLREQIVFSFRIWLNEKIEGNIVSVVRKKDGLKGIKIQKNLLVTTLSVRYPTGLKEERKYFNKRFFEDIVESCKWKVIRENEETK